MQSATNAGKRCTGFAFFFRLPWIVSKVGCGILTANARIPHAVKVKVKCSAPHRSIDIGGGALLLFQALSLSVDKLLKQVTHGQYDAGPRFTCFAA